MSLCDRLSEQQRNAIDVRLAAALPGSRVPRHLWPGLVRYFVQGILPGGFLQAVLCNQPREAAARAAPDVGVVDFAHLLAFLRAHAPSVAWGTRDRVLAWTTTPDRLEISAPPVAGGKPEPLEPSDEHIIMASAGELERLGPMELVLRPASALQLAALLQLALRYPGLSEQTADVATTFIAAARVYFADCPTVLEMMRRGDDPEQDV